jgi:group I intron endonuclease
MASGVYVITNTNSSKQYVGSATDLSQRKKKHFTMLRCARHPSKHLQASFKKHGEPSFVFNTLEELANPTREQLLACEQKWMGILRPAYNKRLVADSNLGVPFTAEHRLSQSVVMRAVAASPEGRTHIANLAEHNRALWADPEHRAKRIASVKAYWTAERRAEVSAVNKARQQHVLEDGTHFGAARQWDAAGKAEHSEKMKTAWVQRKNVTEDDIRSLATAANVAWSVIDMTGVRGKNLVTIHCDVHSADHTVTIAKLRFAQQGCKLCGYQRSSNKQIGRPRA